MEMTVRVFPAQRLRFRTRLSSSDQIQYQKVGTEG